MSEAEVPEFSQKKMEKLFRVGEVGMLKWIDYVKPKTQPEESVHGKTQRVYSLPRSRGKL